MALKKASCVGVVNYELLVKWSNLVHSNKSIVCTDANAAINRFIL